MNYRYSTKPEGFDFVITAKAVHEGRVITITETGKYASHQQAADWIEEYLNRYHEVFDFDIEILTAAESEARNNAGLRKNAGLVA